MEELKRKAGELLYRFKGDTYAFWFGVLEKAGPMATTAAIDRLVHHSVILELNLSSYRLEQSKRNKTS